MRLRTECLFAWILAFAASTPPVGAAPPGYGLTWHDEFSGASLDASKWDFGYGNWMLGPRRSATNIAQAVNVGSGHLTITTASANGQHYTGMVGTAQHFNQTYGYWEARIDFDGSPGMWSAFWLQSPTMGNPIGDPASAGMEIDVIEHRVTDGSANIASGGYHATHWDGYGSSHKSHSSFSANRGLDDGYHTYGLLWTSSEYRYFIDGQHVWTSTPVSRRSEYLILSSEVENGGWAGSIPAGGYGNMINSRTRMKVDYVRVYQPLPSAPSGMMTFASLASPLAMDAQTSVPTNYGGGAPSGAAPSWQGTWNVKKTLGPNDHSPGDDHGSAFLASSTGSISFASPVRIDEMWMYRTTWGSTGEWTVTGTLDGATQWTYSPADFSTWTHVLEGAGRAVDQLSFTGAQFKHIDDLRIAPTIRPSRPAGLMTFSELPQTASTAAVPVAFDKGLPAELGVTFSAGWKYRNQSSPIDDRTANADGTSAFADAAATSIAFNVPVHVEELWIYRSDAVGSGNLLVSGLMDGEVRWSVAPGTFEMWQAVAAGAGVTINELRFTGATNHSIDDLRVSLAPEAIPGDFDLDGEVDAADLSRWRVGFGRSNGATATHGDADGDQDVDGADFLDWQRRLGSGQNELATATQVPEPSVLWLSLTSAVVVFWSRPR